VFANGGREGNTSMSCKRRSTAAGLATHSDGSPLNGGKEACGKDRITTKAAVCGNDRIARSPAVIKRQMLNMVKVVSTITGQTRETAGDLSRAEVSGSRSKVR